MPDLAGRDLPDRLAWALPGSSHDRLVATMRIALPVAIGVLAALLVGAPLTAGGDVSFVLDKNKVEVAKERLKIQTAQYRGQDTKGQPFELTAGSAVQRSSAEPVVQLTDLAAAIRLTDGPATIRANTGQYDMDTQQVRLNGALDVKSQGGYDLRTRDATVDLKSKTLESGGAVTGRTSQGTFSASHMQADLETHVVRLTGGAHLRIQPGRAK